MNVINSIISNRINQFLWMKLIVYSFDSYLNQPGDQLNKRRKNRRIPDFFNHQNGQRWFVPRETLGRGVLYCPANKVN